MRAKSSQLDDMQRLPMAISRKKQILHTTRALKAIFLAGEGDSCSLILKQTRNGREQIKRASGKQAQLSTERVGSVWCVLSSFFPALLATKAEIDFDSGANWAVLQTPTLARYLTNTIHQRPGICCGCACVCVSLCGCGCEDVKSVCVAVSVWIFLKQWKTDRWSTLFCCHI